MKRSEVEEYSTAIAQWDQKHRIVGKTAPATLVEQSLEAIEHYLASAHPSCLVDVGAGSGLLGVPWLYCDPGHLAVFVEPDPKKTAFLHLYLSAKADFKGRYLVLGQKVEDVSRETLERFAEGGYSLVARAFSGPLSFGDAIGASELKNDLIYIFSPGPNGHQFKKWSK